MERLAGRLPPVREGRCAAATAARHSSILSPEGLQRRFGNQGAGALLGSLNRGGGADPQVRSALSRGVVANPAPADSGLSEGAGRAAPDQADAAEIGNAAEVIGLLTPHDNFAGRSPTRFGVGEKIDLGFFSTAARPAVGGLQWVRSSGTGTLAGVTKVGTATYTAPAAAASEQLELQVAGGKKAGRVLSSHPITIVEPESVSMVALPDSAGFVKTNGGTIFPGTFGAGFQANVFIGPKDVSFRFVMFREGIAMSVVTPAGSFFGAPRLHPPSEFGSGVGGNSAKGTRTEGVDTISGDGPPSGITYGTPFCGFSDFVWAIPWEFRPGGTPAGPGKKFATATHHATSTLSCKATIEKGGAGPFCRQIDGKTC